MFFIKFKDLITENKDIKNIAQENSNTCMSERHGPKPTVKSFESISLILVVNVTEIMMM